MKNCAIVCEYNPFHSGHRYQLDCVRESGAGNIVCIMSGNFVQSARPAICDKAIRTECALKGGADAVIELPAVYATASAGYFAEGAVKIISEIKNTDAIAMGATADRDIIMKLVDLKIKRCGEFASLRDRYLKNGKSYNIASTSALADLFGKVYPDGGDVSAALGEPNNILCIEYITAVNKFAPNIQPIIIRRRGALHGEPMSNTEHISATAIRDAVFKGNSDSVKSYVPFKFDEISNLKYDPDEVNALLKAMSVFAVKCYSAEDLRELRDCADGMEYLFNKLSSYSDHEKIVNADEVKRYGKKRIDRIFLDCVLGIKKKFTEYDFCTRLLGCKRDFDFSILPEFVKTTNADIRSAARDENVAKVLGVDIRATALYNTLCHIDGDYFNYSLVKV